MKTLTTNQILRLHTELIAQTGGSDGIRDEGMLESALLAPFQNFDGKDMYPSIQAKAARLGYGLIQNHPFIDGNKRIGTHSMLVFLALNGIELEHTQEELIETILSVASGKTDAAGLLEWILNHQE
ncbi:type II toxin-antitoxin system death-on-curing family toxin [uncultured Oxalobacter sp.]|uniref:type II toxin-antitoxin system death-on-curing family toxin n=1 Tax=uncultured Oxalobacter sp. TaxID=337245 RepID=UPI0025993975|nr:type II toxin-antitoxin system death-on-curing family toxin [uncultured Oxalobacter sp.]